MQTCIVNVSAVRLEKNYDVIIRNKEKSNNDSQIMLTNTEKSKISIDKWTEQIKTFKKKLLAQNHTQFLYPSNQHTKNVILKT